MRITKEMIAEKFVECNDKYFDGKLETPDFRLLRNRDGLFGKFKVCKKPIICVNASADWSEEDFDDIVVHEMIHYYIYSVLKKDPFFSHGLLFRKVRKDIAKKGIKVHIHYKHIQYINKKGGSN